jgi:hypothetical protein
LGENVCRRYPILICTFSLVFWALPAAAQVEFGGAQMSASANTSVGYDANYSNLGGGTDHGLGLAGSGTLAGFYYNPNFLSFSVQPYYNRGQSNSTSGSVFDTSGYNGSVNIFSGSNFPGSISFNQIWNGTGSYGIPGTTGLTTKSNNRDFAIGWGERVPGLPSVSVNYSRGDGSNSVLGSDVGGDVTSNSFGIRSAYRVAGWSLGGGFTHANTDANTTGALEGVGAETSNTSDNAFTFGTGHTLPFLHAGFGINFSRADYNANFGGETSGKSTGTTDNVDANLNLQLWRFPISATAIYMDNLYGSFEEQQLSSGGAGMQTSLSPETRELLLSASTSYHVMPHVVANGFVSRQEIYITGQSFGVTQFGGTVNFFLGKRFKGLTATIGANDSASQQGNEGAGLTANVNYTGNIGRWDVGGNFGYYQNVETLYGLYQTSSLSYGGNLSRRFANGLNWSIAGGGGRTAFVDVAGSGSQAESVSTSLNWRGYTVGGNFSQSTGSSVLTATGLVPVPSPVVSNNLIVYSGRGYGFGAGGSPIRGLSISVSYSNATSSTSGSDTNGLIVTNNNTALTTGVLTYQFRKLYFNASVLQFRQGISTSGIAPSLVTSYYFGVSRWFKLF